MRFSCRIFDYGDTLCLDGGEHDVHCSADGYNVKEDIVGFKTVLCNGFDITALDADRGTERLEALYMLVNGTHTEIAPAGVTDVCPAEPAELGAEQIIGRTHFSDKVDGGRAADGICRIYLDGRAVYHADSEPHCAEYFKRERNVVDLREIFDYTFVFNEQTSHKDGKRGVFHPADLYRAAERGTAVYNYFLHCM